MGRADLFVLERRFRRKRPAAPGNSGVERAGWPSRYIVFPGPLRIPAPNPTNVSNRCSLKPLTPETPEDALLLVLPQRRLTLQVVCRSLPRTQCHRQSGRRQPGKYLQTVACWISRLIGCAPHSDELRAKRMECVQFAHQSLWPAAAQRTRASGRRQPDPPGSARRPRCGACIRPARRPGGPWR